jgi:hypothetical protein
MPDLTPEQVAAQQKAQEAIKAKGARKAALNAKRDAFKANIGKLFTDGEQDATVTGFDKAHLQGSDHVECYTIHYGNPNCQFFIGCEEFLKTFTKKGVV